jgi:methylated-DNA-[protein]-cysteine S-methyltransferase
MQRLKTSYTRVHTDLGTLALGFGERGISRVLLPSADWSDLKPADLARAGLCTETRPPREVAEVAHALQAHIAGEVQDFSGAVLDTSSAPPFLLRVQRAAQKIPAGETRSYGELAALAGSPKAVRAAGSAMATNPWPIIVPCHRVFPRAGFGEYSAGSGVHTKLRLLWREGYRGRTSNVAFDEHKATEHLQAADPRLGKLIDRAGPFTLQATAPSPRVSVAPFTALTQAIISQQLSGKAAATIYDRVAALLDPGEIDAPAAVLALSRVKLREAGLSQNKILALLDLARHSVDGTLPTRAEMQTMSDEEITVRLAQIRGIGRWSAQMLLMFYLGRPDVLPIADLGVQKGFAITYSTRGLPRAKAIERAAQAWSPYASVASWYLWRAVEIDRYARLEHRTG